MPNDLSKFDRFIFATLKVAFIFLALSITLAWIERGW